MRYEVLYVLPNDGAVQREPFEIYEDAACHADEIIQAGGFDPDEGMLLCDGEAIRRIV